MLRRDLRWRRLVHPQLCGVAAGGLGRPLDHDIPPHLVIVVAEAARVSSAGRVEEQARRLDRVAGDRHRTSALVIRSSVAVVDIRDPGGPVPPVDLDTGGHGSGAHLHTMGESIGKVGDVGAGLGVDLAPLQAVPAVDAVRPVAEGAVDDADGANAHGQTQLVGPLPDHGGGAADRVGREGVAVRIPPGPVLPGHRKLTLHLLVVGFQVPVRDRPVGADAVAGEGLEVGRMKAGGVARVVDHRAAHPAAAVVLAQLDGIGATDDALVRPVDAVGTGLVAHPVLVRVPEGPRLENHDAPSVARQPLGQDRATGTGADDAEVDLIAFRVPVHRVLTGKFTATDVEQMPRIVGARTHGSLEHPLQRGAQHQPRPSHASVARTGSSSLAPGRSKGSRELSGPSRMKPRG